MIERFKDVTINGRDFRLGLVPAHIGSWILLQRIANKLADLETFQKVQSFLLAECSLLVRKDESVIPMKLFSEGRFLDADLQYDSATAMDLYMEAFAFNCSPFLDKKADSPAETSPATT